MADIKQFLQDLTKQLHLSMMDEAQQAQLKNYQDNNLGTDTQMGWDLEAALPVLTNDDDWEKLYGLFQDIFYELDKSQSELRVDGLSGFIKNYYGTNTVIKEFEVNDDIVNILSRSTVKDNLKDFLQGKNKNIWATYGREFATDVEKLVEKLNDDGYKKDKKALETLSTVANLFANDTDFQNLFGGSTPAENLASINTIINKATTAKEPANLDAFKGDNGYKAIVLQLIQKEKIRDAFTQKDPSGIVREAIYYGIEQSDYDNSGSKNYVPPKYQDRKRWVDKKIDSVKKWEDDVFGRWNAVHKRQIYSTNAKYIVEAAIKEKVSPITGLGALLEKKSAIVARLAPKARDDFNYLTGILDKLQKQTYFKEATKDGGQMRMLVNEIIKDAVHNDKSDKTAHAALETLAMFQYGAFTSSVRDKFVAANKDLSVFGDKNLSWNKNEITAGVGRAIDGTLKLGTRMLFEGANFIKNKIRNKGSKFETGSKLVKDMANNPDYNDPVKKQKIQDLWAFWNAVKSSTTKDYNPFKKHSNVQKANEQADPTTGQRVIDMKIAQYMAANQVRA